jgi:hypothetical protein
MEALQLPHSPAGVSCSCAGCLVLSAGIQRGCEASAAMSLTRIVLRPLKNKLTKLTKFALSYLAFLPCLASPLTGEGLEAPLRPDHTDRRWPADATTEADRRLLLLGDCQGQHRATGARGRARGLYKAADAGHIGRHVRQLQCR